MKQYSDIELKYLTNDQIKALFFEVRSFLFLEKRNKNKNKKNLEIYLCYITLRVLHTQSEGVSAILEQAAR